MPVPDADRTGIRIREQRRLARLTQRQLADRVGCSYSLLNKVECGARPAGADLCAAVAAALRIDVEVLTGPPASSASHLDALVAPLRTALDLYDLGPLEGMVPRPRQVLVAEADRVCRLVRDGRLRRAAEALPPLLRELTHTVSTAPSTADWRALASTYRSASDVVLKINHLDLARLALDRMDWAAGRAADPCLAAIRQYKRALLYKEGDHEGAGLRLIADGHRLLDGQASREALAVIGQLHLGASALAARAGAQATVDRHLAEARTLASRVGGEATEVHRLGFGAGNVALHQFGAAVAMRQYGAALTQARTIRLSAGTSASRRARFLVDRARTEMETGRLDASLRHLAEARRTAPEQTRYYPGTRETVRALVRLSRSTPETLGRMAAWIGL
jgi:XRE family transcriptional regulator, fatty acid utilization regulator